MKNRIISSISLAALTALVLSSCAKVPQAQIDMANAAISQAKTAGAEVYTPESFNALNDSMNTIMVNIEAEKSKFIKNFDGVKQQLSAVTLLAGEVQQQTETRKEEMKQEIQNAIAEVKTLIDANRQLILDAPKGKEGTAALQAISSEVDAIENSILETSSLLETGDYPATLTKANVAKEKALAINMELSQVIAKYKGGAKTKKG